MHAVWIFSKQKFCFRFHRDNASAKSQSVISYTEAVRMWEEESFSRASGTSPDGSLYSKIRASYNLRWRSWNRKRKTQRCGPLWSAVCTLSNEGNVRHGSPGWTPDLGAIWATAVASRRKGGGLPCIHSRFHIVRQRRSFKGLRTLRDCKA